MKYESQKHHRRSIRLPDYAYTQPGGYFITICACQRESLFGTIMNGGMQLSPLGQIVQQEWFRSAQMRREIELHDDEIVIMPNHLHGIVWLIDVVDVGADGVRPDDGVRPGIAVRPDVNRPGDGIPQSTNDQGAYHAPLPFHGHDAVVCDDTVGADGVRPNGIRPNDGVRPESIHTDVQGARGAPLHREARSLASFVAGIKASVTSRARRELDAWNIWQRNYYEHIIRNEAELAQIRHYIQTNPLRWEADQLHPAAPPNRFNQE
jgi:putative transposase